MTDYVLYYWPIPFRGQFIRAALAYAGKSWSEKGPGDIRELKDAPPAEAPIPFMGPPILIDNATGVVLSQTTAILLYLGETLHLLPEGPAARALALKIVADALDVIDDITLDGGRLMWTQRRWDAFVPRLRKWMTLWEATAQRHGVTPTSCALLGGDTLTIADIVTATMWATMGERFPALAEMLREAAPLTAALTLRVTTLPPLALLAAKARQDYGEVYCGGQIEASLRRVVA